MNVNIALIRQSFAAVKPHADQFTEHFYEELFRRYPAARGLFSKTDMGKQRKALAAALSHIVDFWNDTAHLEDYLVKSGRRHVGYGTEEAHFPMVGEALLATFEFFFEKQWTEELKNNWLGVFQFAQEHMLKGMAEARLTRVEGPLEMPVLSLEEMARTLARETFRRALEEESGVLQELAREKARDMLRRAIEAEAGEVMRLVARKQAA